MTGPLEQLLADDHTGMAALLDRADADPDHLDRAAFDEFRARLLRHIGIEEKLLFRTAKAKRDGDPLPIAAKLRSDHSSIATLLVPTPTHAIVGELRRRLARHDTLEEGLDGMYAQVEALLTPDELDDLLRRIDDFPQPPPAPYTDNARILAKVRALLGE